MAREQQQGFWKYRAVRDSDGAGSTEFTSNDVHRGFLNGQDHTERNVVFGNHGIGLRRGMSPLKKAKSGWKDL